jgi:hypothetical protein
MRGEMERGGDERVIEDVGVLGFKRKRDSDWEGHEELEDSLTNGESKGFDCPSVTSPEEPSSLGSRSSLNEMDVTSTGNIRVFTLPPVRWRLCEPVIILGEDLDKSGGGVE